MKKIIEADFYVPHHPAFWRATLRAMKLTTAIILIATLHVSAATTAQKITYSGENVSLTKVFNAIEEQLGYGVLMPHKLIETAKPVTLIVTDGTLDDVLQKCFAFQPWKLTYIITGHTILISEQGPSPEQLRQMDLPIKRVRVSGTVYNESGEPLSGASVTIKEIQKGTITNSKGEFDLGAVAVNSTLNISFVGYAPQQMKVKDEANFKVYLKTAKDQLDKVVVQAYGVTTQRLTTGNIGTVTAEEISKQPVMNPIEALQGQVPGVVVTNVTGYASGSVKIEVRGRNTINPGFPSDPLYIVDGVPLTILDLTQGSGYAGGSQGVIQSGIYSPAGGQSPFFSLNPDDIESIEILKDADATAIYGSRGSNGVILITTKRGKAGKTKMDLKAYDGMSETPRYYSMLNTSQYVAMRRTALANDGLPIDINNAPDLVAWDTTRYTNWQRYLWGHMGRQVQAEASLSGGDARTTFRLSAAYLYQTEIMAFNGANQRGSLDWNIGHKSIDQRFGLDFTGSYSILSSNQIFLPSAITLPPNAPAIFDSKGNLNYQGWSPLNYTFNFGSFLQPYSTKTNFLNSGMVLRFSPIKALTFRVNLGYNNVMTDQSQLIPIVSQDPAQSPLGNSQYGTTLAHNVIVEPQVEFNTFIGKGKLSVLAGGSEQNNLTSAKYLSGSGYSNDALLSSVINAPIRNAANNGAQYKYLAVFGRVNYNWANKFILNVNVRRDGSSKFGPGRQFGNFGSFGGAYIFTEENWIKRNLPLLSFGKIRASYGTVGGDQIGNYAYLSQWLYGVGLYNGGQPLSPIGHTDSLLQWQVNKKAEVGISLGVLKNKVILELSYYQDRCGNQLVSFPTPAFTGFTNVTANTPADVQNSGYEAILTGKIAESKNFALSLKLNIGVNKNRLISYPNLALSPYAGTYFIGRSLNVRRLLHYTGIDPQTGAYAFQDKNHDGQITFDYSGQTADDTYFYDMSEKYDGGFTTTVAYKNWDLSAFFYFRSQLGNSANGTLDAPGDETNQPTAILNNRWQKPGDIAATPRFTTIPPQSFSYYAYQSDALICDASFIRLQNLSLSYSLRESALKKVSLANLKFFLQGKNLFYITKYNGIDPETFAFQAPPLARTVVVGMSCTF